MGNMSFAQFKGMTTGDGGNYYDGPQVGFFKCNPGESVVVRIMLDSIEEADVSMVHSIRTDKGFRTVACLRTPQDPIDQCPLCKYGDEAKKENVAKTVVMLKMIQYTEEGPKAVVWQRSARQWLPTLNAYIDNYGPLSDFCCKINRTGTKLDTKYEIIPNLNANIYNENDYPKMTGAFDNYESIGRSILKKDRNEMMIYLETGAFPEKKKAEKKEEEVLQAPMESPYAPQCNAASSTITDSDIPF